MAEQKKKGVLSSFSKTYWVVVFFEFMERGSYYGMMSVLSIYLTDVLGFAKTSVGLIKGTIQPILYFLPIISGALADRFGYRKTLTIAFALLGGGYFLTSQVTSYTAVFLALCVMALGAGTFKPIISGSIARTTDKSNSTLGFGIYYWSINLGAFLFPLILVPFLKNSPVFGWKWVIIASALGTGAMIIPTLFIYKEPPRDKSEKQKKELNLIKTVANAFEIIYSPFVLIYHYLRSAQSRKVLVYIIIGLLLVLSFWQYINREPVTEKFNRASLIRNSSALTFFIERDVMKKYSYQIDKEHVLRKGQYSIIFDFETKLESIDLVKKVIRNGQDLSVTIFKPESADLYQALNNQLSPYVEFSKADLDSVLAAFRQNKVNRVSVTIAKPDNFDSYKNDLLNKLQSYSDFASLGREPIENLFDAVTEKSIIKVEVSDETTGDAFEVQKVASNNLHVKIFQPDELASFKAELVEKIRSYENYVSMTHPELEELINNAQNRSFFTLFIVLLFISSLIILAIQKIYEHAARNVKLTYNLVATLIIVGVIWLLPGLDMFSRIVSTVIYFTVLSLFTIETDDTEKFKANFRFLLMIFIYSGFWILYFQMFDSVLWYVKAYVDATSLNNAVNSALGFIGIHINWFFDVEHVTVINAGTIILLQLFVSSIVKNAKALPTMISGIVMATIGMAILAISTDIWIFMAGIIIFSIGEMTAHPKFISYVGLTAPKDRVATYMGYIFLYGVIGSSIGAILGANLYVHFVDKLNQPRTLWLIFSGIGIATIVGLLLYNKFTPKTDEGEYDSK